MTTEDIENLEAYLFCRISDLLQREHKLQSKAEKERKEGKLGFYISNTAAIGELTCVLSKRHRKRWTDFLDKKTGKPYEELDTRR